MRCLFLFAGLLVLIALSVMIGAADIGPAASILGAFGSGDEAVITIVQQLRLPRALLAACVGAGLGASGAALQGFTRNPLAAPGILGFSASAALGAVLALYFGFAAFVPVAALIGAGLGAVFILALVGPRKGAGTLILAGVGISALATAVTGLIMNFAPNPWALSEIVYWMMGSLRNADWGGVYLCAPLVLAGIGLLAFIGPDIRTLSLGEDTALSLGVSLRRVQIILVMGTALCVGSGVAVAGAIGFVGLFVPHIVRLALTSDPAKLIPYSALVGAGFLVLCDTLLRVISGPGTTLYLGILTSLIGVPFFLWLAVRDKKL